MSTKTFIVNYINEYVVKFDNGIITILNRIQCNNENVQKFLVVLSSEQNVNSFLQIY